MLIIATLLSLVCATVLRKYDVRKYVDIFKARSRPSVNKHNPTCGMCFVECAMSYSCCNLYDQEDFIWKEPLLIYSRFA